MTDLNLAHLRSIAGAATPGPWHETPYDNAIESVDWDCIADDVYYSQDRWYIAAFDPPTVLSLIARVEQAEHRVARYKALAETRLETIQRVRDLHQPVERTIYVPVFDEFDEPCQTDTYCTGCGGERLYRYCPTLKALELGDPE